MNRVYFPNLNGLRFIAAFLVLLHHNERVKQRFAQVNFWETDFIQVIGKLGVILFFVLSGFLITYLLLKEESDSGTISIKKFYIRRMLRIWPLYYLVVLSGLFVLPYIPLLSYGNDFTMLFANYRSNVFLFILFLPNLAYVLNASIPFISQAWSVGVEEHFYLQWPLLLKSVRNKKLLLMGVILTYNLVRFLSFAMSKAEPENYGLKVFVHFIELFNIDCMAIGGLAAYFYFEKNRKFLNFAYNRFVQITVLSLLVILISIGYRFPYFHYQFYSVLFALLIINLATNSHSIVKLEYPALNYLGKISYGIYMYHPLMLYITAATLLNFGITNQFVELFSGTVLTVIVSSVSYEFLEKYFLKKKIGYSKIISGDNVD